MSAKGEKQGCLSTLFPFLRSRNNSVNEVLPYRLRDDFLSPAEFSFYKVLSSVLGTHFTIQSKVRLADIFFVSDPHKRATYFNKISQRHLDFLVCDAVTMKPLLGIELDDASHKRSSRRERDEFLEKVFQAAGLPLLRFPVQRVYNPKDIAAQIAPLLKGKTVSSNVNRPTPAITTNNANPTSTVPLCPKCGIPMVLRTVSRGKHKGKQFYGCANYPHCRQVKPAPPRKVG